MMKNITFFQAANLSDAEAKSQFIVRTKEFEIVMSDIRRNDMSGSIQHYIFVGQRGSGKSTLLRRIQAEINTDEALGEKLVAVNLSEEQAGIYRLHDLWHKVNESLSAMGYVIRDIDWRQYENDLSAYARELYTAMQEELRLKGKKLILLLDNIDRILDHVKQADNHLLREMLMNHKDVRIVGGSTRLSEHYWQYDQPFYQFFRILRLEPLTQAELLELLSFWAGLLAEKGIKEFIQKNTGKLNALRILSDGMPRTMLHLLELAIHRPDENGYSYLRQIVDKATPIYQERLGQLSEQQQKVLVELSFYWDATDIARLSRTARMNSKLLSAVLGQLVKLKIVEKKKGKGKNYYYLLCERFFNLWLIMTQGGPKQKNSVKWLTAFLETWYEKPELIEVYERFANDVDSGSIAADGAVMRATAFAHSRHLSIDQRDRMIDSIKKIAGDNTAYLSMLPERSSEIFETAKKYVNEKNYDKAISLINEIEDGASKDFVLAYIYHDKGDIINAEKYYLMAIDKGDVDALYNLALLYQNNKQTTEAEKYYLMAIDKGDVNALNNLAFLYVDNKQTAEAEKYYLMAIDKGDVGAMYNLALLYQNNKQTTEAEKYYLMAIDKGHVKALYNLAWLYHNNNQTTEAEKYYLMAIDKGNVDAMYNLALLYQDNNQTTEAEKYYLIAIVKGDVEALYNLANMYSDNGKLEEAEKYYLMAIDKGQVSAYLNLAVLYWVNNRNPDEALRLFQRYKEQQSSLDIRGSFIEKMLHTWTGSPEALEGSTSLIAAAMNEVSTDILSGFVSSILVHHQVQTVWSWFHDAEIGEQLRDMLRPMYFATARLIDSAETRAVLLTMPSELAETVDQVYDSIIERRRFYYGTA